MRIFTDIEFLEGRIPRRENFRPALLQFERECITTFLDDTVLGAFAYGSVNRSDCNPASDIDYYVVIDDPLHKMVISAASEWAMQHFNVQMQVRVFDDSLAQKGFFRIDPSFYQHLALSVEIYGHHGINPLEILGQKDMLFTDSVMQSMEHDLAALDNLYTASHSGDDARAKLAKRILEKPFHAIRRYLQHELGGVVPYRVGIGEGEKLAIPVTDTKQHILNLYEKVCSDESRLDIIRKIELLSKEYIFLLDQRLGDPKKKDGSLSLSCADARTPRHLNKLCSMHHSLVDSILSSYDAAYDFIRLNAIEMKK